MKIVISGDSAFCLELSFTPQMSEWESERIGRFFDGVCAVIMAVVDEPEKAK